MGFSQYEAESFHSNAIFQQSMAWCCGEAPLSPTAEHHTVDILLYVVVLLNRGLLNPTLHPPSSASAAISFSVYTFAVYCSFSIVLSVSFMYRSLPIFCLRILMCHCLCLPVPQPNIVLSPSPVQHQPSRLNDGWLRPVYPECNCIGWRLIWVSIVVPIYCHWMSIPYQLCHYPRLEKASAA